MAGKAAGSRATYALVSYIYWLVGLFQVGLKNQNVSRPLLSKCITHHFVIGAEIGSMPLGHTLAQVDIPLINA